MEPMAIVRQLWEDIHTQNWEALPGYFLEEAQISWPNTREIFSPLGFQEANRLSPGKWKIRLERLEGLGDQVISVVHVSAEDAPSFYACSFFRFSSDKIRELTEYWGENGDAPEWRRSLNL